jgi:uncharacterized DUF497 family protein
MTLRESETVVLERDTPERGLRKGDLGAVVEPYDPDELEVEFVRASGKTQALVELRTNDVRSVRERPECRNARWDNALIVADTRRDYGERRYQAFGLIAERLHVLVFTPRSRTTHIISLRKANKREVKRYEAQAQSRTSGS